VPNKDARRRMRSEGQPAEYQKRTSLLRNTSLFGLGG
jgi:hypothetical protein